MTLGQTLKGDAELAWEQSRKKRASAKALRWRVLACRRNGRGQALSLSQEKGG